MSFKIKLCIIWSNRHLPFIHSLSPSSFPELRYPSKRGKLFWSGFNNTPSFSSYQQNLQSNLLLYPKAWCWMTNQLRLVARLILLPLVLKLCRSLKIVVFVVSIMALTFDKTVEGVPYIWASFGTHLQESEVAWPCVIHGLIVLHLSIRHIALVSKKHHYHTRSIDITWYLLVPILDCFKCFAIRAIVNQKRSDSFAIEQWSHSLELFLPQSVPDVQLCPFVVCVFNLDELSLYLHLSRLLLLFREHVVHESISDASFPDSGLPYEDHFVVEVRTLLIKDVLEPSTSIHSAHHLNFILVYYYC